MIGKISLGAMAAVFALAVATSAPVGARPTVGSSMPIQIENNVDLVKKKRAKAKKSKAGKCGTYKYYSKKTRKCIDSRDKK